MSKSLRLTVLAAVAAVIFAPTQALAQSQPAPPQPQLSLDLHAPDHTHTKRVKVSAMIRNEGGETATETQIQLVAQRPLRCSRITRPIGNVSVGGALRETLFLRPRARRTGWYKLWVGVTSPDTAAVWERVRVRVRARDRAQR